MRERERESEREGVYSKDSNGGVDFFPLFSQFFFRKKNYIHPISPTRAVPYLSFSSLCIRVQCHSNGVSHICMLMYTYILHAGTKKVYNVAFSFIRFDKRQIYA